MLKPRLLVPQRNRCLQRSRHCCKMATKPHRKPMCCVWLHEAAALPNRLCHGGHPSFKKPGQTHRCLDHPWRYHGFSSCNRPSPAPCRYVLMRCCVCFCVQHHVASSDGVSARAKGHILTWLCVPRAASSTASSGHACPVQLRVSSAERKRAPVPALGIL